MLSRPLSAFLARHSIHYGWVVIGVTFCTMLATASAMGMPGVLMVPLHDEFAWSGSSISGAMALRLLFFGFVGPFAAAMMQRCGIRFTISVAMSLIVVGLGGLATMTRLWQLWLFWGVLVGTGSGMTAIVLGATVTTRWFSTRRGLILGILTASAASGQLVSVPIAAWLDGQFGWRFAMLPAIAVCLGATLLVFLFGANHPEDVGLQPYGEQASPVERRPHPASSVKLVFDALGEAAGHKMFWVLFFTFAVCGFTTNGLIQTHFIPFCQDLGRSQLAGAGILALMGVFDFAGTILSGWLADRFDNRALLAFYFALRATALFVISYIPTSNVGLTVFAVVYGLEWIATVPPTVKLAAEAFGRDRAPIVFGWIFTGHQLGAATAALGAGLIRDEIGSYIPAFLIGGMLCVMAALAAAPLRQRRVLAPPLASSGS